MLSWLQRNSVRVLSLIGSGLKATGSLIKRGTGWLWELLRTAKLAGVHMDTAGIVHAKFSFDEGKVNISSKLAFSLELGDKSIVYNPETKQITMQL